MKEWRCRGKMDTSKSEDLDLFQGEIEVGALLRDIGKCAWEAGTGVARLILSSSSDVFCPGPGLGIVCHRPFDHGREGGRCACCYLMSKDRELQYLALMF